MDQTSDQTTDQTHTSRASAGVGTAAVPTVPGQRTGSPDEAHRGAVPAPAYRSRRDAGATQPAARPERQQESLLRRAVAIAALAGIALVHVLDLPGKLAETPYLGVAYIGLIATALVLAELLVRTDSVLVWLAAAGTGAATIGGYVVNRTVGMPGAMDDIGNWLEPLGVASLFVEGVLVLVSVLAVLRNRRG